MSNIPALAHGHVINQPMKMNDITKSLYDLSKQLTEAGFPNLRVKGQRLIGRPTYRFPDLEELLAHTGNNSLQILRQADGKWIARTAVFPDDMTDDEDKQQYVVSGEGELVHEAIARLYIAMKEAEKEQKKDK